MNHILQNIFFPNRIEFRKKIRNRTEIMRFLTNNEGNGTIFGVYKSGSQQMLLGSVAYLGVDNNREFVEIHWYDPMGEYISNVKIFIDTIDALCPFENLPKGIKLLTKYFQNQFASLIQSKWALAA